MNGYFDLHCDTLVKTYNSKTHLRRNAHHYKLEGITGPHVQVFALCGENDFEKPGLIHLYLKHTRRELERCTDLAVLCQTGSEIEAALAQTKTAVILSVEGAELLGCTEEGLETAYQAGVRIVGITWNHNNALAGCAVLDGGGLTADGRGFLRYMEKRGMVTDISHLSDAGIEDLAAFSSAPFIASHSNARRVCGHPRNLTDAQFTEIVRRGGLCGINLYCPFVRAQGTCTVSHVIAHIEHFCALGGDRVLAIGADFDGCDELPEGIAGPGDMHVLYEELLKLGYSQQTTDRIFFENAYQYFRYKI